SGAWYSKNCDVANSSGGLLQTNGWCGSIYAEPITPASAAVCGGMGVAGTNCAATSGFLDGHVGGRNMADHDFIGETEVQEAYIRWYYKPSVGFSWSGQKVLDFNRGNHGGGIYWGGMGYNIGAGAPSTASPDIGIVNNHADNTIHRQNQGNDISVQGGRWY